MVGKRISYDSDIDKKAVGIRIKEVRSNSNMTMEALGKKLNVSKSAIAHWEKGTNLPNKDRLKAISEILKTSVSYLLYGKKTLLDMNEDERKQYIMQLKNENENNYLRTKSDLNNEILTSILYDDFITFDFEQADEQVIELLVKVFGLFEEKPNDRNLHEALANLILELYASEQEDLESKLIILDRKYNSLRNWYSKSEN